MSGDIQVVGIEGVESIWVRFPSIGVRAVLSRDQAIELAQQLLEVAAPEMERTP